MVCVLAEAERRYGAHGIPFFTLASTLRSTAKIVVDGAQTGIDVRAGTNGEGVGCVLAPPTVVTGGGADRKKNLLK